MGISGSEFRDDEAQDGEDAEDVEAVGATYRVQNVSFAQDERG